MNAALTCCVFSCERSFVMPLHSSCKRVHGVCPGAVAIAAPAQSAITSPPFDIREWRPHSVQPHGCIASVMTSNLLGAISWGAFAIEIAINWALSHGYRYTLFGELHSYRNVSAAMPPGVHLDGAGAWSSAATINWAKPRAMLELLERGPHECPWVFFLDGDAIINRASASVEQVLLQPYLSKAPAAVKVVLACHSPFGHNGDCLPCRCCRAGHCPADELALLPRNDGSWVNSGVVFAKNDARGEARRMLAWWASGGEGACDPMEVPKGSSNRAKHRPAASRARTDRSGPPQPFASRAPPIALLGEQLCAQRMQRRFPDAVDVLNAAVFNTPTWFDPARFAWFDSRVHTHLGVLATVVANESRFGRSWACLSSSSFVCHLYDVPAASRLAMVRAKLEESRPALGAALVQRGERYVSTTGSSPQSGDAGPSRETSCPTLGVAINSNVRYSVPREHLLRSLELAGVPMNQVHVFIGGDRDGRAAVSTDARGVRYYAVEHDSIDFSGLVHIGERRDLFPGVTQWFYLHDTTEVGRGFWPAITHYCQQLPSCALPITCRWPSSSMGLYDASFVYSAAANATLRRMKNVHDVPPAVWKGFALKEEDALLKECQQLRGGSCAMIRKGNWRDASGKMSCWSKELGRDICICNVVEALPPREVYSAGSAPRQVASFPCADVRKFKANYGQAGMPYTVGDAAKYVLKP